MKTRVTIYGTMLWLAAALVVTTPFFSASAQSGRAVRTPTPTPTPIPQPGSPSRSDARPGFVVDSSGDVYKLVFPTSYEGSLRKKYADIDRVIHSLNTSFVEQLNRVGAGGYKLVSAVTGEAN